MYDVSFIHTNAAINQEAINTLGVSYTGSSFDSDATSLEALWSAHIVAQMSGFWTFSRAVWRVQEGAVRDKSYAVTGGKSAEALPPQCAVLVTKVTGIPGRKNRGRWYLAGLMETDVAGSGALTTTGKLDWQTACSQFILGMPALHFAPMLLHNEAAIPPPADHFPTPITDFAVQVTIATQRRRLRG
jgi:hypothetical protein